MRLRLATVILLTTALTPALAAEIPVISRIDAVTVFPSGAEVTRLAEARIEAGEHSLIFDSLPGELQPETIRVEGTAAGMIEIGSVDSKLVYLPSTTRDESRRRIERDMEALQDERGALDQAIADAEHQKSLMQQLASGAFAAPVKEGYPCIAVSEEIGRLLNLVGGKMQELSKTVLDARLRQRAIDKQVNDLATELAGLAPREQAQMRVTVHLAAPAKSSGRFRLKYRIANAGWHPIYDARLTTPVTDAKAKIELVRRAEVMQSTTEDWADVALTLSTARPVGDTAAPDLWPDEIVPFADVRTGNLGGSADALQRLEAPEAVAESAAPPDSEGKYKNDASVVQRQAVVGIAGFQALYAIAGRVSVDNTGTAKKVRIGTDAIDAKLSAEAVPKLDPNAYLTAAFALAGETPLLPGPVMLYRDGVFMGQGGLPMLSPGEETRLGFGADDLIKVKRIEVKRNRGEEGLLTSSNIDERAYDITVKNLHDFAVPVTVLDQMPVSNVEAITVETLPGMTPPTAKDYEKKRGVLAWQFDLAPKAEKALKHGFKIAWPKDMNVGMNIN
ncbi:MAG: mucoidy inhibitor MuiA family protein [Hyphomicrobiales bacterium]